MQNPEPAAESPFGSLPEEVPTHFSDANGGYGFVVPVVPSPMPFIEGAMGAGEWTNARFDEVNISGTGYMSVFAKAVNGYLLIAVALDPAFDAKLENSDGCALLFDVDHDGGTAPQDDDLMVFIERQPPVQRVLSRGNGSGWTTETWPNDWAAAMADSGSTQEVYEFKINASAVLSGEDGDIIGFGVFLYENNLPIYNSVYWPDGIDPANSPENVPDMWGHLILNRSSLVINEVSSMGTDLEYVELYNNHSTELHIDNLSVLDQDGNEAVLPNMTIPAQANLIVRSGTGINDLDFGDGRGMVFTGGSDWWGDAGDDVLLRFGGNTCTLDYMQFGTGPEVDPHPTETASTSSWTQDTPQLQAPSSTEYLRRLQDGRDLNLSSDWSLFDAIINSLHHIALSPMFAFPSTYSVGAGGTISGYKALGWNDALETDLNRTWQPLWGTTDGLGSVVGSAGDWLSGYTVDYAAGTVLGYDNITVTDASSLISNASSIRVEPGEAWQIAVVSGAGQISSAGTTLPVPFVVEVSDEFGNLLEGENVWFNITTTGLSGDGSLSTSNPVVTDSSGRASTAFTLDSEIGTNTVTAECGCSSVSSVIFSAIGNLPIISTSLDSNVTMAPAGRTYMYFINYGNGGTEAAQDVYLNATLPSSITYVSDSSGIVPSVQGLTYSWHFPALQVGYYDFVLICRIGPGVFNGTLISLSFTIEYSNQAGFRMPIETSNTVVIVATDKPVLNVPPDIADVPDLVVRHDFDYRFDLSPYITDPEEHPDGLRLILSDTVSARVDPADNLAIILNYSIGYLGLDLPLNITVTDGTGSDWDLISVSVTANFPPELSTLLPDVILDEDTDTFPFRISDFFFDRDVDSMTFSHGETPLNIEILSNQTVHITPPLNWFGITNVTFRATDPSGAFAEDIVLITVNPVNDPPVLLPVPNQVGKEGKAWTLDLSPYIQDVDNALSEITISTSNPNVAIDGLNITFSYSGSVDLDTIIITVSDGTEEVEGEINVKVVSTGLLENPLLWLLIIIVVSIIISAVIAARLRRELVVNDAFLIYMDGALMAQAAQRITPSIDSEIFSSMLTAIQDFVRDSFDRGGNGGLKKIEFRDKTIAIERSDSGLFSIALIYKGKGSEEKLFRKARNLMTFTEKEYGQILENWDGDSEKLKGLNTMLRQTFKIKT